MTPETSLVPGSYEDWRHCITVKCGLALTPAFIAARIEALEDRSDPHTQRYLSRWGEAQHARTLDWFRRARQESAETG